MFPKIPATCRPKVVFIFSMRLQSADDSACRPPPRGAKRQGDRTGGSANRNGYQKIVWSVYRLYPEQYASRGFNNRVIRPKFL